MSCAKSVLPAYMAVSTGKPARLPCHSVQVDTAHLPPQTQSISRSPRHDPSVNRTAEISNDVILCPIGLVPRHRESPQVVANQGESDPARPVNRFQVRVSGAVAMRYEPRRYLSDLLARASSAGTKDADTSQVSPCGATVAFCLRQQSGASVSFIVPGDRRVSARGGRSPRLARNCRDAGVTHATLTRRCQVDPTPHREAIDLGNRPLFTDKAPSGE